MAAEGANFSCLCFVLEIWIKIAVFRRLPLLGWWIKTARVFLSARKLCRSFQVWKRSNFSYASSYFSCVTVWKCSVLTADLLCGRKFFSVINVKSRRGFAVSVEGKRSDSSVNQGGKITSNLYVCMHTVPLNCL